jgi:four helix bundle protein
MAKSIVKDKSYQFALEIVKFCSHLRDQKQFDIAKQLLRAGTSIGANVEEALAGQSKKDFYAKMCIASKEAREANYWLRLIKDAELFDNKKTDKLLIDSQELVKILTSIVKTGYDNKVIVVNSKDNSKLRTQN